MKPFFTCYFVIVSDIKYLKMGDKVTALAKLAGSRRVTHNQYTIILLKRDKYTKIWIIVWSIIGEPVPFFTSPWLLLPLKKVYRLWLAIKIFTGSSSLEPFLGIFIGSLWIGLPAPLQLFNEWNPLDFV